MENLYESKTAFQRTCRMECQASFSEGSVPTSMMNMQGLRSDSLLGTSGPGLAAPTLRSW